MPAEDKTETVFQKLGEIPVVNDGWTSAWEYYSKVKDYNSLTRLSLGMAESGVKVAGKISTPVLSPVIVRYQPQSKLDACCNEHKNKTQKVTSFTFKLD